MRILFAPPARRRDRNLVWIPLRPVGLRRPADGPFPDLPQCLKQQLPVVGQHHDIGPVPADLRMEGRRVHVRPVAGIDHGDHLVRPDLPGIVNGRAVGMFDVE